MGTKPRSSAEVNGMSKPMLSTSSSACDTRGATGIRHNPSCRRSTGSGRGRALTQYSITDDRRLDTLRTAQHPMGCRC